MPSGRPRSCVVCEHECSGEINTDLQIGLSYAEILERYDGFSLRTLQEHATGHLRGSGSQLRELSEKIYSRVPMRSYEAARKDMLDYGAAIVHESMERLRSVAECTHSLKAEEILIQAAREWRNYAEVMTDASPVDPPKLTITLVRATPEGSYREPSDTV